MIKTDSRTVTNGDTFVAIKGSKCDGYDYIMDAIVNGATKIVVDHDIDIKIEKIIVPDTKKWLNDYLKNNYSNLINEMNIIGITGTNGKTTTSYLTYQILNKLNSKTAYIGTIGFYINGVKIKDLDNTTPDILTLYELLLEAKKENCINVVMEVSSHSLVQDRIHGIRLKEAAFTNLTQDHLDYHSNMNNYLNAKRLIFNNLDGKIIVNNDDFYSKFFICDNSITVGKNNALYEIIDDTSFKYLDKIYNIDTGLKGEYNVYNYLISLALVHNLGFSIDDIINIKVSPPKGRCELIKYNNQDVVIDYAHTPDAVEKIIKTFSKENDVITIIGCGGNRDKMKRPLMGSVATNNSKYVIFTNDNPRFEDPIDIINDMLSGVNKENYAVEIDRKSAIIKGLEMLKNETLLILGKGHEDYQIINGVKFHFDDAEVVNNHKKLTKK